jgi:hypothetical protein
MKWYFTILLFSFVSLVKAQTGFTYSYVDPCTRQLKVLYIPPGQSTVTVNYLGFIRSFTETEFQNGSFDSWIATCQQQASTQPCDELKTQTQTNTNMIITQNIISTITSVTASATMSMSNTISNSVSNSSSSTESSGGNSKKNRNNGTNQSSSSPTGNISSNSTTSNGAPQSGGGQGNPQSNGGTGTSQGETNNQNGGNPSGSGNSTEGGSGQTQPSVNNPSSNPSSNSSSNPSSNSSNGGSGSGSQSGSGSGGGKGVDGEKTPDEIKKENTSGGNGGTTNSVANAAESSSGNGGGSKVKVGSVIGTGDIVAIRSNEDGSNQFKGTFSMTKSNTNNTRAKGALLNFTTTINNSNLTLYGSFTNKKKTNTIIAANSSMVDFGRNVFNTSTVLQSQRFGKVTVMGGANFTLGVMAKEPFSNLSAVGGGFVPFKASKKISGNLLVLGVYSPFTKFYEGKWWDSGLLLVPFSSWDYTISKNFKYNVSFSGTYELKGSVLQYQILTGGKILL